MSKTSRRSSSGATSVSSFVKSTNDAPAPMTSIERLQHVRNATTRLKYILEKALHTEHLSADHANEGHARHYLEKLRKRVAQFEHHPGKVGTTATGPKSKAWLEQEVAKQLARGQAILSPAEDESAKVAETEGSVTYQNLNLHHVQECVNELEEIHHLLSKKDVASRVSIELLKDQVSFHIDDFDYLLDNRIHQYVSENIREGANYTSPIPDGTTSGKAPVGLCTIELMDVVVGTTPARVANGVLDHLDAKIVILRNRLSTAMDSIEVAAATPEAQILQDRQRREYAIMKSRIEDAKQSSETLRTRWNSEESAFLEKVRSGSHADLKELADSKKIKELEIAEAASRSHDDMCFRCLPFVTPQYHRRYQLTYSTPCQIRIAIRVFSRSKDAFVSIPNTCPEYFQYISKHPQLETDSLAALDYLIPHNHKLWIPFDEFPEMVMGKRCALRDGDNIVDHERAMEEHKEVGAYFIMKGGERILRALLMQRCNVPINIHRDRFATQGPNFTADAIVMRCKRPSGLTVQNYFYYSTVGEVLFSFARKVVWHVPVTLLLFCMKPGLTALHLFQVLTAGVEGTANHEPRVEALLQHHRSKPYGELNNHIDFLTVLGRMYRQYQQNSSAFRFIPDLHPQLECHHDAWYGLFMLRRHVLPHLNCDAATPPLPKNTTDFSSWPGEAIQDELISKFHATSTATRQLYGFIDGKTAHQGNDVPAYQELFSSSQVLVGAFEVCLNRALRMFSYRMGSHINPGLLKDINSLVNCANIETSRVESITSQVRKLSDYCCSRMGNGAMAPLHKLLITGNFVLDREEDFYCPQTSGWVVMAEHLNFFRFFEQLKCLHRGKTVAEMRSSDVRKYPPEAYGFICMVHSPDGEDCGVLNHMSISTVVASSMEQSDWVRLQKWIDEACPNLRYHSDTSITDRFHKTVPMWVEGNVVGYLTEKEAADAAEMLRDRKSLKDSSSVTLSGLVLRRKVRPLNTVEIINVPRGGKDPAGLYIFAEHGRLMRPICKIESNTVPAANSGKLPFPMPFVGTWEQTWLDIASVPSDLNDANRQLGKKYEYMEQNGSNLISVTSATIPFFEHNCSPRNLFQCGLSKQTAGTQLEALAWRKEAKLFRMYTPQRSIVRTLPMDYYNLDDVSLGVNATIAILAYTGYDMDDAVIINDTAVQRGFLHAGVTIAKVIHAGKEKDKKESDGVSVFHNINNQGEAYCDELDHQGLPLKRTPAHRVTFERDHSRPTLRNHNAIYCTARRNKHVDPITKEVTYDYARHHTTPWKSLDKGEAAFIQKVIPLEYDGPDVVSALVVFRIPRNPAVGDKFSSRHGQKGTLPLHVKAMDLPFITESGITPDVLINPHAFPSRMTVGMVLEILGAKLGAIEGRFIDYSAWSLIDNEPRGANILGEALASNGYQRYGRERMICGMSGEEMAADVFTGVSGYQRLRHMVNDKWQARSRTDSHTHRAVSKTGQPVKGRKRHGGVRIGEMERDGLLSHGISEVVIDRLMHVSDKTKAFICSNCGSMLSVFEKHSTRFSTWKSCKFCSVNDDEETDTIKMIDIPQVFRLWVTELAAIGVRVTLSVK